MSNHIKQSALLANLGGPSLPPVALNIASQYQFCVDAGAAAATVFFDDSTTVGLHDHIATATHAFMQSVRGGMTVMDGSDPATLQSGVDAFAAGYLGRIQQELRLFHGEDCRTGPMCFSSMANSMGAR